MPMKTLLGPGPQHHPVFIMIYYKVIFVKSESFPLKKISKVDCINLKTGLFKVEKWTLVHSSKKGAS
ncbi:hypothetical protein ACFLWZ_03990 [Chloroflexota bacterium]